MSGLRPSRRQVLRASLIGGIAVYLAPLGSRAYAALFEQQELTRPAWNVRDGSLKYRIDATAKVIGDKVFARDIRARDMPHWPQQQGHALVLRVTTADRRYLGFDLSLLGSDLAPDRIVTAADLARDGITFPDYYGDRHAVARGPDAGLSGPSRRDPDLPGFRALPLCQVQAAVQRCGDPLRRGHRVAHARSVGLVALCAGRRVHPRRRRRVLAGAAGSVFTDLPEPRTGVARARCRGRYRRARHVPRQRDCA